ncbi:MAG: hypothetical protein MUW56_20415 [Chryseobacterium sp.]|uniref:hypothetical protein n=1 Tax=Chryseobacterium sp. TaxID=1871047 RepID=UPI0025C414A9|nr:hypothetical protein [Chryseobacterium sp.]MCJ7935923.1 hypothetical protein [Chryseobacterium sp.]
MKKKLILGIFASIPMLFNSQVGINNTTPVATLDITAKTTGTIPGVPEGLIAPRLTISDLNLKSSAYGTAQSGTLIYVNNASNAAPSGQTINITTQGYYYFDGSVWQKVTNGIPANIYNSDGSLNGNRIVTMGTNNIAWNSTATTTTATNLNANAVTTGKALDISTTGLTTGTALNIASSNGTSNTNGIIKITNTSASGTGTFATLQANNTAGSGLNILNNGNVGINTNAPAANLHVSGNARITNTPMSTTSADKYLVVDGSGNVLSRESVRARTANLALNGTTNWTNAAPDTIVDFYFVDKVHTITLPAATNFAGRLIRFYIYGGSGCNVVIGSVYGPTQVGPGLIPSGFSYSAQGGGATLTITGDANRFDFVDVISDGYFWWVDNRN